MEALTITIILPVKPGGIVKALDWLKSAEYPEAAFEVLVAEGKRPSRQRNRAAAVAKGEVIYFLDDDSLVSAVNLHLLARHFADPSVAVVGGPSLTPSGDSLWQRGFGVALSSILGGGAVRNRYRQSGAVRVSDDRELILCNLGFRASVYRALGGLDERLYPNEENELLDRIARRGDKILHDPNLVVHRSQRPTFGAFVKQLFTYGRGRAEQTLIGGGSGVLPYVPVLFLLYLATLPFIDNPVYYLPLLCYGITIVLFACGEARAAGAWQMVPCLLAIFPALHLAYGAGMIVGFASPRFRRQKFSDGEVTVRTVKKMGEPFDSSTQEEGGHGQTAGGADSCRHSQ